MSVLHWDEIDTVLLDMDGTLLDLYYDNYFWGEYLPNYLVQLSKQPEHSHKSWYHCELEAVAGTLDWYCIDHWQQRFGVDILNLKRQIKHKIKIKSGATEFVNRLKMIGKSVYLVTNAHPKTLALKLEYTEIGHLFDGIISSHEFGYAKESSTFWDALIQSLMYEPTRTLLIDDNEHVLETAQKSGIYWLLCPAQPDSSRKRKEFSNFPLLHYFESITPE